MGDVLLNNIDNVLVMVTAALLMMMVITRLMRRIIITVGSLQQYTNGQKQTDKSTYYKISSHAVSQMYDLDTMTVRI